METSPAIGGHVMEVSRALALVVFVLICAPVTALAQEDDKGKGRRPLFVAGALLVAVDSQLDRRSRHYGVRSFPTGWTRS